MDWGELARTTLLPFFIAVVIVVISLQLLSQTFDITTLALYFAPAVSIIALLYGIYLSKKVLARDTGTPAMQKIAGAIQQGSVAYINRQFKTVLPFTIIIALLLWYALGLGTALTFLLGAFLSGLAGYYGMYMAVRGNVRAASAARRSLRSGRGVRLEDAGE